MKKHSFDLGGAVIGITICSMLFLLPAPLKAQGLQSSKSNNVVEHYRLLPASLLSGNKYELQQKQGKWVTQSSADYQLEPLVDIKHGYLLIQDEGTGGGTITQEVAIFKKADGGVVTGVRQSEFDGVKVSSKLDFYLVKQEFKNITSEVLPPIKLAMFLDEKFSKKKIEAYGKHLNDLSPWTISYSLPRIGTTLRIQCTKEAISSYLQTFSADPATKAQLEEIQQNIRYQEIEMPWNRRSGKFDLEKKIVTMTR